MQKLVISLPLPLADQWFEINDCVAVLCTTPRSHHSEKTNYKQSLCLGRRKRIHRWFSNSEMVVTALLRERHIYSTHTLNRKRLY